MIRYKIDELNVDTHSFVINVSLFNAAIAK